MARIRTIKPEFFKNLKLYELEEETKLPVRVAFAGLWTVADREGRFVWVPRQLKIDCLPYDDVDFSRVLHALTTRGFIKKYVVNNEEFGVIPGFLEHQVINNRESASKLPEPTDSNTLTREPRVDDALATRAVRKGREGKGRELTTTTSEKKFSDDHMRFARAMFKLIRDVAPATKEPNFEKWADDIRLLNERDKRPLDEIAAVFRFANQDEFWKSNILSAGKFREKYSALHAKMLSQRPPDAPSYNQANAQAFQRFLSNEPGQESRQ